MPLNLPGLQNRRVQVRANFAARIPGADMSLRRGVLPVIADEVAAGNAAELQAIANQEKQIFLDSCDSSYLDRRGLPYGITRPAAAPSAGAASVIGQGGATIAAGTTLEYQPLDLLFTVSDAVVLPGTILTTGTIEIEAVAGGSGGNLPAGAALVFSVAVPQIQAIATVLSSGGTLAPSQGLTGGTDTGTDAELRALLYSRLQTPPQGGAVQDYVAWAKQAPGVTRAWVFPARRGVGTVDVEFVCDGRASIIPLGADVTAVQAAINANRPVTSDSAAIFLAVGYINPEIGSLVVAPGYVAGAVQSAVSASLAALFATTTPGGAAFGDGIVAGQTPGLVTVEQIDTAIANTPGVVTFDLLSPTTDQQMGNGIIPLLGGVSFV